MKKNRKMKIFSVTLICAVMLLGINCVTLGGNMRANAADVTFENFKQNIITENAKFSTFGSKDNLMIGQTESKVIVKDDKLTYNQVSTTRFKNPIDISDNKDITPFVKFSVFSKDKVKRDLDAVIFTLIDTQDETNHVSIMLGLWNSIHTRSTAYAKGSGQNFMGYHYSSSSKGLSKPHDQGTIMDYDGISSTGTIGFYYDNEQKSFYTDTYWSNYDTRNAVTTNINNVKLCKIRDLKDTTTSGAETTAYNKDIKTAYLKITMVRGWHLYEDEYGDKSNFTIFSSQHRGGGANVHTLSDSGAQCTLKEIDGVDLKFTNNNLTQEIPLSYYANDFISAKKVTLPNLKSTSIMQIPKDEIVFTENLFVRVTDFDNKTINIQGVKNGKWTNKCYFDALKFQKYNISYFSDSLYVNLITTVAVSVQNIEPDFSNMIFAEDSSNLFSEATTKRADMSVGNSKIYNGAKVNVNKTKTVKYNKDINISDNTKEDVLFEFMPLPYTIGKYDYREISFKFTNKILPSEFFTLVLKYDYNNPKIDACTAGGNNQDQYGAKKIRNSDEYAFTAIAQNLVGVANGNNTYSSIKFYYDKAENCLYTSPGHNYITQSAEKLKVRDFDSDLNLKIFNKYEMIGDVKTPTYNTITQEKWDGFSSDMIELEISVKGVSQDVESVQYGILTIDNETMADRLSAEVISKGIVDYQYLIPPAKYYNVYTQENDDFNKAFSGIKVYNEKNEEVSVFENSFLPKTVGRYTICYGVLEKNKSYGYKSYVDVGTLLESAPIVINYDNCDVKDGMRFYIGNKTDLSLSAETNLFLGSNKACAVVTKIYKGGTLIRTVEGDDKIFTFTETGDYEIKYTFEDYNKRQSKATLNVEVIRTFIELKDSNIENMITDRDIDDIIINESGIAVKDYIFNKDEPIMTLSEKFFEYNVKIQVSGSDNIYVNYDSNYAFVNTGNFTIKYIITYKLTQESSAIACEFFRYLSVVDTIKPVFNDADSISGDIVDIQTNDDNQRIVKVVKGSQIVINKETATDFRKNGNVNIDNIIVLITTPSGQTFDITNDIAYSSYVLQIDSLGKYYITYIANDGSMKTTKTYVVESKSDWISIVLSETNVDKIIFGAEYNFKTAQLINQNNETLKDNIKIKIITESREILIDGYSWTPDFVGKADLIYYCLINQEKIEKIFKIEIFDFVKPQIEVGKFKNKLKTGEYFNIPQISVKDDWDKMLSYKTYLIYENTKEEIAYSSIKLEKNGTYILQIECSDSSGNIQIRQIQFKVEKGFNWTIVIIIVALIVFLSLTIITIILLRKRKKKKYEKNI